MLERVPSLSPGCGAELVEEALANAREAIELSIEYRRDESEPIPADVAPPEQRVHIEIDAT